MTEIRPEIGVGDVAGLSIVIGLPGAIYFNAVATLGSRDSRV